MQLHSVKAMKALYPVDNDGLEVLYHCYSFDGVMGIKALRKGASLLFQSGRGVQISLASKTNEIGYVRLSQSPKKNMSNNLFAGNTRLLNIKDPVQRTDSDNINPSIDIKTWMNDNILVLYKDLMVSRVEDMTPSQRELNGIFEEFIFNYANASDCTLDILSQAKFIPHSSPAQLTQELHEARAELVEKQRQFQLPYAQLKRQYADEEGLEEEEVELNEEELKEMYDLKIDIQNELIANLEKQLRENMSGPDRDERWYANMDASFNQICDFINKIDSRKFIGPLIYSSQSGGPMIMEGRRTDIFNSTVPGRIKRDGKEIVEIDNILVSFVNKYQERYSLTDEAYDEIFENLSSFRICLEYFIENIDDIVIRKVTSPNTVSQENLDFIEKNKSSYMALKKIHAYTDWIFPQLKEETGQLTCVADNWEKEKKKKVIVGIKVLLKFINITITNKVDNKGISSPAGKPPPVTRQKSVSRTPASTPGGPLSLRENRSISTEELKEGVAQSRVVAQGLKDDSGNKSLSYMEFLKFRIKKINNLVDYISSEFFKLDRCHSLIENATQIPSLLKTCIETNDFIKNEKTSSQNKVFVDKFNKQLSESKKDVNELKDKIGRLNLMDERQDGFSTPTRPTNSDDVDMDDDDGSGFRESFKMLQRENYRLQQDNNKLYEKNTLLAAEQVDMQNELGESEGKYHVT